MTRGYFVSQNECFTNLKFWMLLLRHCKFMKTNWLHDVIEIHEKRF